MSAEWELQKEQQTVRTFGYLVLWGGTADPERLEALWAAADNASLVAACGYRNGRRRFSSGIEVVRRLDLGEIARLAEEIRAQTENGRIPAQEKRASVLGQTTE